MAARLCSGYGSIGVAGIERLNHSMAEHRKAITGT